MTGVQRFQRVEQVQAIQYIKGDKEAEQAIRGWTGLPIDQPINLSTSVWVVKTGTRAIVLVTDEDFKKDFTEVGSTLFNAS